MAVITGIGSKLYAGRVGGVAYNFSGDVGAITELGGDAVQIDTSPIDSSFDEFLIGRRNGHINFNAFYNPGSVPEGIARWAVNFPEDGTKTIGAYALRGTVGADAHFGEFHQFGYRLQEAANGALTMPLVLASGGQGPVLGRVIWVGTDASPVAHTGVDFGTADAVHAITGNTLANPTIVTSVAHGLASNDSILISGSDSTPVINGQRVVTVTGPDTFSVPVNVSSAGTMGSFTVTSRRYGMVLSAMLFGLTSGSMTPIWEQSANGSTGWTAITGSTMAAMTVADGVRYVRTLTNQLTYRFIRVSSTGTFVGANWVALASTPASAFDA